MTNGQGFLHHVLGGITTFAQHQLAEHCLSQERLAVMQESIKQVVDASEPRIRLSSADPDERHLAELERRLDRTEQDLIEARKPLSTLDDCLEQVRQVLDRPETCLHIRPLSIRLNRLGIKLDDDSTEPGETITLVELASLGERRIGVLVRFAREEAGPTSAVWG